MLLNNRFIYLDADKDAPNLAGIGEMYKRIRFGHKPEDKTVADLSKIGGMSQLDLPTGDAKIVPADQIQSAQERSKEEREALRARILAEEEAKRERQRLADEIPPREEKPVLAKPPKTARRRPKGRREKGVRIEYDGTVRHINRPADKKKEENEPTGNNGSELNVSRKNEKALQKAADQLSQLISYPVEAKLHVMGVSRDKLKEGFAKLQRRGKGPEGFKWHDWNPFTNHSERNTWAAKIYKECEAAWKKAQSSGKNEDWNRAKELFVRLSDSIDDYYNQAEKVVKSLGAKYAIRISLLADLYDLPMGVNVADLSQKSTAVKPEPFYSSDEVEDNPQFVAQREKIVIESLRNQSEINNFFGDYFKERPRYIFTGTDSARRGPWEQLAASLKVPQQEKLKNSIYFKGLSPKAILYTVNQMILLRNMYSVGDISRKMQSDYFKELERALGRINGGATYYYERKDLDVPQYFLTGKWVRRKG